MPEDLIIPRSENSPYVEFNLKWGFLTIKGNSFLIHPDKFYQPLNDLIEVYCLQPADITVINIYLKYYNSASTRCIVSILKKLEYLTKKGKIVTVNWYYEPGDSDMQEEGEMMRDLVKLKFNLIEQANPLV